MGTPSRLVGKVRAAQGCARARDVTLRPQGTRRETLVTDRRGRFASGCPMRCVTG